MLLDEVGGHVREVDLYPWGEPFAAIVISHLAVSLKVGF
jgi:hypothetical protein